MRFVVLSFLLGLGFLLSSVPAVRAENVEKCEQEIDFELKVKICKGVIERASRALAESGDRELIRDEFALAIKKYELLMDIFKSERERINDDLRSAHFNRGKSHWYSKRYFAAVQDWWHWVALDPWKFFALVLVIFGLLYGTFRVLSWFLRSVFRMLSEIFHGILRLLSQICRRILHLLSPICRYLHARQQAVAKVAWHIRWWGGPGPSAMVYFEEENGIFSPPTPDVGLDPDLKPRPPVAPNEPDGGGE